MKIRQEDFMLIKSKRIAKNNIQLGVQDRYLLRSKTNPAEKEVHKEYWKLIVVDINQDAYKVAEQVNVGDYVSVKEGMLRKGNNINESTIFVHKLESKTFEELSEKQTTEN